MFELCNNNRSSATFKQVFRELSRLRRCVMCSDIRLVGLLISFIFHFLSLQLFGYDFLLIYLCQQIGSETTAEREDAD